MQSWRGKTSLCMLLELWCRDLESVLGMPAQLVAFRINVVGYEPWHGVASVLEQPWPATRMQSTAAYKFRDARGARGEVLLKQPFCIFRYATDAAEDESIAEEAHNHPINSTTLKTSSPWSSGYRGADQSCGRQ